MPDIYDQETGEITGFVRPFADVLRDIQGGQVADEAATAMQDLVNAVKEHGKKGLLRIDIKVEPMKGNSQALAVSGEITNRPPRPEPVSAIFFYDDAGNLLRDDPRQLALPGLREVPKTNIDHVKEIGK